MNLETFFLFFLLLEFSMRESMLVTFINWHEVSLRICNHACLLL